MPNLHRELLIVLGDSNRTRRFCLPDDTLWIVETDSDKAIEECCNSIWTTAENHSWSPPARLLVFRGTVDLLRSAKMSSLRNVINSRGVLGLAVIALLQAYEGTCPTLGSRRYLLLEKTPGSHENCCWCGQVNCKEDWCADMSEHALKSGDVYDADATMYDADATTWTSPESLGVSKTLPMRHIL